MLYQTETRMRTTRERERESCSWYGQLSTVTWLTVETENCDKRHAVCRTVTSCEAVTDKYQAIRVLLPTSFWDIFVDCKLALKQRRSR